MRISLINIQTIEGNNVIPPLGLMYIAAVTREKGHHVQLLDLDPDEFDIISKVRNFSPDLIGLSFLTTESEKACTLSHKLKKNLPKVIICSGGVHTTVDTENVLRRFNIDFCVVGEGEITFLEVIDRITKNQSYYDVKGVCLIKDGQVLMNQRRELIKDLDSIPFPARDLVDFSNIYLTFPGVIRGKYVRSTNIIAGRGCYFNCSFCSVQKTFGHEYRLRSPSNVLQEIIQLQKIYGIKGVRFQDSSFTSNSKWITSLCEGIIKQGIKFTWTCDTRADSVNQEMLRLMKKAGCVQVDFGVESGSSKIIKMLNKGIHQQKIISAVKMTKEAGIRVGASFMIGNLDEELSDLEMTFNLAKKINSNYTIFLFTIPYPGTQLWEIAKERKLLSQEITYGNEWNSRTAKFPILSEKISKEDLQFYRAKFQNHFFIRNYFGLSNIIIGFLILWIMIKLPSVTLNAIKGVLRSKRLDSLIEEILIAYRRSLYKYY